MRRSYVNIVGLAYVVHKKLEKPFTQLLSQAFPALAQTKRCLYHLALLEQSGTLADPHTVTMFSIEEPAAVMNTFISYSANYEDVVLNRIFGNQESGVYVDVGAEHPIVGNDTYNMYLRGWRGINFEPNADYHAQLVEHRPHDKNFCLALSSETGAAQTFYQVDGTGLSTFNQSYADQQVKNGRQVKVIEVPTTTLAEVLKRENVSKIDLLKVDVEGHEEKVLIGNDWNLFRPSVIVLEATIPQSPDRQKTNITELLKGHGYRHAHFDGLNDFYVESSFEVDELAFLPPNHFDNFERADVVNLRTAYENLCSSFLAQEESSKLSAAHINQTTSQLNQLKAFSDNQNHELETLRTEVGNLKEEISKNKLALAQAIQPIQFETFKISVAATLVVRRYTLGHEAVVSSNADPLKIIRKSLLFDSKWYVDVYPDVKAANIDAAEHYLKYGALEGRNPGPLFNTKLYNLKHPALRNSNINPLVHFELEGFKGLRLS